MKRGVMLVIVLLLMPIVAAELEEEVTAVISEMGEVYKFKGSKGTYNGDGRLQLGYYIQKTEDKKSTTLSMYTHRSTSHLLSNEVDRFRKTFAANYEEIVELRNDPSTYKNMETHTRVEIKKDADRDKYGIRVIYTIRCADDQVMLAISQEKKNLDRRPSTEPYVTGAKLDAHLAFTKLRKRGLCIPTKETLEEQEPEQPDYYEHYLDFLSFFPEKIEPEGSTCDLTVKAEAGSVWLSDDGIGFRPVRNQAERITEGSYVVVGDGIATLRFDQCNGKRSLFEKYEVQLTSGQVLRVDEAKYGDRFTNTLTVGPGFIDANIQEMQDTDVKFKTPSAEIELKGTVFDIEIDEEGNTNVRSHAGVLEVKGKDASVILSRGQKSTITRGHNPTQPEEFTSESIAFLVIAFASAFLAIVYVLWRRKLKVLKAYKKVKRKVKRII